MVRFAGWAELQAWSTEIDVAQLLGPEIVFRHVGEISKRPDAARRGDGPASFFINFAVKRGHWAFTGINTAAGQLKLRFGLILMGDQHFATLQQNGVSPRATGVDAVRLGRFSKPWDHGRIALCLVTPI